MNKKNSSTMAMKEWVRRMQPFQLYVVLGLTIAFFLLELIVSHLTHALTLLMDSYHTLCNIMALGGCILTIKYGKDTPKQVFEMKKAPSESESIGEELTSNPAKCHDHKKTKASVTRSNQEKKLKNTFGWARTDVIFMLICCVFLASLSFSIFVEACQTLVHIDHHDEMHHSISVLCLGACGLLLNGVCYLLIGGYTFHQGSFLYVTESGNVVLSKIVVDQSLQQGARRLSRSKTIHPMIGHQKQRQGFWEMARDVNGCILVVICALLVYFTDKDTAKYIDPIMAIISSTLIMFLSYPYMKESCLILLQTMPDTIDIDTLKIQLLNHFPDIVNIHDFHIWQLTAHRVISTVHIIFQNPKVYKQLIEEVKEFFNDYGITQVTIQPEFFKKNASMDSLNSKYAPNCLVACLEDGCKDNHCCPSYKDKSITKSHSKEVIPGNTTPDLKSVKILNDELAHLHNGSVSNINLNLPAENKQSTPVHNCDSNVTSIPQLPTEQKQQDTTTSSEDSLSASKNESISESENKVTSTTSIPLEIANEDTGDNSTKDSNSKIICNDVSSKEEETGANSEVKEVITDLNTVD
uniref:Zinc/cadmium resistance protein isoform X1 n=2 Tax=Diabrotica virgifera virgifera TaxID=50390 RepID=A0A6P7H0N1_DIAVI